MFTGLVEATSNITKIDTSTGMIRLEIDRPESFQDCRMGDSIAVNGGCLTVAALSDASLAFDVNGETASVTTLTQWPLGCEVNLERAMTANHRLGGHMVSGHIDGISRLVAIDRLSSGWEMTVAIPKVFQALVIPKGSICLDGVSLTLNEIIDHNEGCNLRLTLIPTTLNHTHFRHLPDNWQFNIEFDLVGKYILRQQQLRDVTASQ